ncbi:unnamed protein product, partial [Adineta ricciae]
DLRVQVARLVACKVTLAARVDSFHESAQGQQGKALLSEIEKRLEKLTESAPVKAIKPLASPIDSKRKIRGGRICRKMKERYRRSELRAGVEQSTFATIVEDAYESDLGLSRGRIGQSGSGILRTPQIDSKTKARISQKLQKTLQQQ